jgi:hypothetical protein
MLATDIVYSRVSSLSTMGLVSLMTTGSIVRMWRMDDLPTHGLYNAAHGAQGSFRSLSEDGRLHRIGHASAGVVLFTLTGRNTSRTEASCCQLVS